MMVLPLRDCQAVLAPVGFGDVDFHAAVTCAAGIVVVRGDRFAFAGLLAEQFERYARHRPDWPARWAAAQSGWPRGTPDLTDAAHEDELWQRELWSRLAAQPDAPPTPPPRPRLPG